MKASHIIKIIRTLESCETIDQYNCWLEWAKRMKLGKDHDLVWSKACEKVWTVCKHIKKEDFKAANL